MSDFFLAYLTVAMAQKRSEKNPSSTFNVSEKKAIENHCSALDGYDLPKAKMIKMDGWSNMIYGVIFKLPITSTIYHYSST